MSKRVVDFNAAALTAFKRRQVAGHLEVLRPDSPLAKSVLEAGGRHIDLDWLVGTLQSIPEAKHESLRFVARTAAATVLGREPTPMEFAWYLYSMLRDAEAKGYLHTFQQPPKRARP